MIGTTSHGLETFMMHQEVGCTMKLTAGYSPRMQTTETSGSMMPSWDGSGRVQNITMNLRPQKPNMFIPQHMQVGSTSQQATASGSSIGIPTPNG